METRRVLLGVKCSSIGPIEHLGEDKDGEELRSLCQVQVLVHIQDLSMTSKGWATAAFWAISMRWSDLW